MTPTPVATFTISASSIPDRPGVVSLVYPAPRRPLALVPITASQMDARRVDVAQRVAAKATSRIGTDQQQKEEGIVTHPLASLGRALIGIGVGLLLLKWALK